MLDLILWTFRAKCDDSFLNLGSTTTVVIFPWVVSAIAGIQSLLVQSASYSRIAAFFASVTLIAKYSLIVC